MKVYLVVGWEEYEQDVILAACKTEAIAKEIVEDYKNQDYDKYNGSIRSGYDIKEMDVVE